jgi:hypothetical protein
MHIEWYGQSAFRLRSNGTTVFIDPFGDMSMSRERGMRWDYPAIEDVEADLPWLRTSTPTTTASRRSRATLSSSARRQGRTPRPSAR